MKFEILRYFALLHLFLRIVIPSSSSMGPELNPFSGVVLDYQKNNIYLNQVHEYEQNSRISPPSSLKQLNEDGAGEAVDQIQVIRQDIGNNETIHVFDSEIEMENPERGDLMLVDTNSFYFRKTKSSLYYDKTEEKWFLAWVNGTTQPQIKNFPFLIPVSFCMDNRNGAGGALTQEYDIQVSVGNALSLELSYAMSPITLSMTLGLSVGNSFTYSGIFECDPSAGQVAQMFIEPFYVEIPQLSRRQVAYKQYKGLVIKGETEILRNYKIIAKHKPNHVCLIGTDLEELKCKEMNLGM